MSVRGSVGWGRETTQEDLRRRRDRVRDGKNNDDIQNRIKNFLTNVGKRSEISLDLSPFQEER